jgi:hypothetical protein
MTFIQNLALLFLLFSLPTYSQITWQKKHSPVENVQTIAVSGNNITYAATTSYGIFKSIDEGTTWNNISLGLLDSIIRVVEVATDEKVFVGTGSNGIYQFVNGTWTAINAGLPTSNILVTGFAKGTGGIMYMINSTGQIYKWNGSNWTNITFNFPTFGKTIAVGPQGNLYAGAFTHGVYLFDGISNWSLVGNPMSNKLVIKIAISSSDTIYALCNSNNVFRCPTTGGNWIAANTGLPAVNMNFIATDAQNQVFISPSVGTAAIYRSTNGGSNWSSVTNSLSTTNFSSIAFSTSGNIYAGASGIFKSINGGSNWVDKSNGLDAPRSIICFKCTRNGTFFAGTRVGIWRSLDQGLTWQYKNTGIAHLNILQITETVGGFVIFHGYDAVPKGAIYRSSNNGDSWTQVAANGCDLYTKIKQHKTDTLWATSRFSGATSLSYSIDQGITWLNNPLDISAIWDIDVSKENTIFLGTESEGVSRSDNGGQTFILGVGNSGPWYGNVYNIEIDEDGFIFAGSDWWMHSLWYSSPEENGDIWTQFTDPDLTVHGVQDIVFDQNNNAYLACEDGGVRMASKSNWNVNTNWIQSSVGLSSPTANVRELSFDTLGFMYAVSYTNSGLKGGLYKSFTAINLPQSSVFTFTGNGSWDDANNWAFLRKPPTTLSGNKLIIIDHLPGGQCLINSALSLPNDVKLKIRPDKILKVSN